MIDQPPFDAFYAQVHGGRVPFPWQARLAARLGDGDAWPAEIAVPTGLGKTSCLDVAVWWLASQVDRAARDRTAPTRIWWLVNRRLLVDATADHAERLAQLLSQHDDETPIGRVGARLRSLSAAEDAEPLEVRRLRGGAAVGRPTDPSQPAVLLSTLPMYGSRLLFRGYGSSRSMRPIDAALAGTDTLVLVDEAHLAHHLMALFEPLEECDGATSHVVPQARRRPVVVSLTATGGDVPGERFDLDADDLAHPIVQKRLRAAKPTVLVEAPSRSDAAKALASTAVSSLTRRGRATSCVVFANTPATARATASALSKALGTERAEIVLLTGRQREQEAAAARGRILDPVAGVPAGVAAPERTRHFVVVATQTLEVGADVDFEVLVTEACGVRSLTQRLGRLNRLGEHLDAAGVYVHIEPPPRTGQLPSWPVYGEEPLRVLARLRSAIADGVVDLCPAHVNDVLGSPGDDPGRAPEILPALLWEWVKTTNPPPGEAPVEPFFSGLADPDRRLSVCWRAHVPGAGTVIWPRVRDVETIELPISEAREVLAGQGSHVSRLAADRATVELAEVDRLRPGDIVVLACDAGLLDADGWNPEATSSAVDVTTSSHGLPLDADAIGQLAAVATGAEVAAVVEAEDIDDRRDALVELLAVLREATARALPLAEWLIVLDALDLEGGYEAPLGEVPRLLVRHTLASGRVDEYDQLSLSAAATHLDAHGAGVGARAAAVAAAVGLGPRVTATVKMAATFHDVGKADFRFQRWLDPRSIAAAPLAKSSGRASRWETDRIASGWPRGGRHEELSGRLVRGWLEARSPIEIADLDIDLLMHLVVSHHGHARPMLVPVDDRTGVPVTAEIGGATVTVGGCLATPDWQQPRRFRSLNDRYGHWGLALLEAILRQSDHAVSAGGWAGSDEAVI